MRKGLCLVLLLFSAFSAMGQQVYIESGNAISSFSYRNSDDQSLSNLYGSHHFYLKAGYHTLFRGKRLNYSFGVSLMHYGASGSDTNLGNIFEWDVKYAGIDLGIDYTIAKVRFSSLSNSGIDVYIKACVSPELLIQGTQVINDDVYDLRGKEQFNNPFIFTRGGAGVNYSINKMIVVYAEYMGGIGFPVRLKDTEDEERLRLNSHNIGFGIMVNLPSYN